MSRPTNDAQDGAGLWPSSPINSHRHWRHYASQQSKIKLLSNLSYMDEKYRIRKLRTMRLHSSHRRPLKPFNKPTNTKIRPATQLQRGLLISPTCPLRMKIGPSERGASRAYPPTIVDLPKPFNEPTNQKFSQRFN
mmetsp:Transcript_13478/g.24751  ORF Transcript_13478/g.24751 Transcript_13478/m.24751 type:complete len:136 (+) Transcript_13478:138-545(+)